MCDVNVLVKKMFTNRLNYLKQVKIVLKMKTGQADSQLCTHLKQGIGNSVNVIILKSYSRRDF